MADIVKLPEENTVPIEDTSTKTPLADAMNESLSFDDFTALCYRGYKYDLTELGNSKRLKELLQGKVLWVNGLECFIVYKSSRWVKDNSGSIVRGWELLLSDINEEKQFYSELLAQLKQYSSKYNIEPIEAALKSKIKELKRHYLSSQTKNTIYATQELFKSQQGISVQLDTIDSKGHYLGCKNGIVDLRDGTLIENDPSYLMMKSSNVEYNADSLCPEWLLFINKIMLDNRDKIEFLQLLAGQMLIGEAIKDKMPIFIGKGANGKSVFLDVLSELLGDYAEQSAPDVLTGKSSKQEYYVASLQGKRLVTMVETKRGDKLDEAIVKMIVASGRVSARVPCGKPFSYQPVFTPVLCTNYMPYISTDEASWRRLVIVPFDYTVPVDERDPNFKKHLLHKEAKGIFNWMVQGAVKLYQKGRIEIPDVLITALNKYSADFDNISQFISESQSDLYNESHVANLKCRITELRKMYEQWCRDNGYQALSTRNFKQELLKKDYTVKKSTGGHDYIYGIEIVKSGDAQELILSTFGDDVESTKTSKSKRLKTVQDAICQEDNSVLTHGDKLAHEREFETDCINEEKWLDDYFSIITSEPDS